MYNRPREANSKSHFTWLISDEQGPGVLQWSPIPESAFLSLGARQVWLSEPLQGTDMPPLPTKFQRVLGFLGAPVSQRITVGFSPRTGRGYRRPVVSGNLSFSLVFLLAYHDLRTAKLDVTGTYVW